MRIALAQLNPTVGDVEGNTRRVLEAIDAARDAGADLLVTPELALLGYPPRDLMLREGIVEACEAAVIRIAGHDHGMITVVGHPRRCSGGLRPACNSASVCHDGRVVATYDKCLLPGYDVFDEDRYFSPGSEPGLVEVGGRRIGIAICEDLWQGRDAGGPCTYAAHPVSDLAARGCDVLLSMNASPFVVGKWNRHVTQLQAVAAEHALPVIAVNQVGGADDLVFDGRSVALDGAGRLLACLPGWVPAVKVVDLAGPTVAVEPAEALEESWQALVLGLRDYCVKTGHVEVVLGVSGGIDSALTATIAAAALGPRHVRSLLLPSRFTAAQSRRDALDLVSRLDMPPPHEVPIGLVHETLRSTLADPLGDPPSGVTDENLQARLRGLVLMAVSNATGALLLATSNKSELAVGYSTLYGDMCGAVSVIGDIAKTRVYELCRWINEHHDEVGFARPPIPEPSITRLPTAELRPDQTDQDTLPPYEVLDEIVARYVEREESVARIIEATGIDPALVRDVAIRIDRNEFKRHQASVILKVTPRAFGRGRPMPIVMKDSTVPSPQECAAG